MGKAMLILGGIVQYIRENADFNITDRIMWYFFAYCSNALVSHHDDVIKWKHFTRYWPFVRRIHRSPVKSPQKGQWHGALMFSLICTRINGWVNNGEAGDLRRHRAHYDVTVMMHVAEVCAPHWCKWERPLTELLMIQFVDAYMCHPAWMY